MLAQPNATEYSGYYHTYVSKVEGDVLEMMANQPDALSAYVEENEERLDYKYEEGKWTIKEVIMHILDTEQVFAYRMLRIARGDETPLAGFDQNLFISSTDFSHIDAGDLIRNIENQRAHTFSLINSLTEESMLNMGTASDQPFTVRSIIYVIAGHVKHHFDILKDRYAE